jgi:hypothetical protein
MLYSFYFFIFCIDISTNFIGQNFYSQMKNYIRRGDNPNIQSDDLDQNEANMPISYEDESYEIKTDYRKPTLPITQAPSRNQYAPNFLPNNFQKNINEGMNQKDLDTNQFNEFNSNYDSRQKYPPHNPNQQHHFDNQTPIYVPPFLLNNVRPSRRNQHNAPKDYLPWSIANIFICVIIALPALFFSVQTRDMKRMGNIKKAKANSKRSLILNIIASVVGLLTILLAVILRFALYQLFVNNDVQSQNVPIYIAGGK